MNTQHRRTSSSITDAVYPRRGKGQRKPTGLKREVSPRHGFRLSDQLSPETLKALGWNPLTGKPRGSQKGTR
jgi:hypothetical protein